MKYNMAHFVYRPRTIDELCCPHLLADERPYIVEKVISLNKTDYDNFKSDMLADRQFLEENVLVQDKNNPVIRCLLIRQGSADTGILVVPDRAWVAYAALYMA